MEERQWNRKSTVRELRQVPFSLREGISIKDTHKEKFEISILKVFFE